MRDTGEAIMNIFATNEVRKPSRIGSLVVISGAMLGAVGAVAPALSADLPIDYPPYQPTYYNNYNNCYTCGKPVVAPLPQIEAAVTVVERPIVERGPVERRWMQRDYIERQYSPYPTTTPYVYPEQYRYSHYCGAACMEQYPAYEQAPYREPWRRLGYVGGYSPPAPAAYEFEREPRAPYRYAASARRPYGYYRPSYESEYSPAYDYKPVYEHEPSPRPPGGVLGGYYGPGYLK
jgi:hypothetical protein